MAVSVRIDDGAWRKMVRTVREIGARTVAVGIPGDDSEMADLATHHEFGAPRAGIPERSFLRSTMNEQEQAFANAMARLTAQYLNGAMNADRVLNTLGMFAANEVKKKIRSNIPPALSARTIARKGSSIALIDTGRLLNTVTWWIVD